MSDPPAAPTGAIAPKSAKLRFRLGPGGKVMPSRATMFGTMRPPPIPHKPLIKHIATRLLANPPHKAQRTHQTPPAVSMFLWPYTAPKRPPIRTKAPWVRGYDATTQVDWIRVAPNASPIASPELIPAWRSVTSRWSYRGGDVGFRRCGWNIIGLPRVWWTLAPVAVG